MPNRQTSEPMHLVEAPTAIATLSESMDEAMTALASFDAERLELIEEQMRSLTATQLAREVDEDREGLPELLRKHRLLGEMLNATAANLRVVVTILEAKRKRTSDSLGNSHHHRSNLVSWPR